MPWGVAAAAVVGAYSANKQSKAAKSAANAQGQAADKAAQVQWDMFNQARQDNEPWRQAGLVALPQMMSLLGLPTSAVTNAASGQSSAMSPSGAIEWFDWSRPTPVAEPGRYSSDPLYKAAWDEVWASHNGRFDKTSDRNAIERHLNEVYQREAAKRQPAAGSGGTGMTQTQAFDAFRATPGYQFGLTEGVRALDSSAAAAGGLFSGKAAKALTKFGTDYADQQGFTPYYNRLAGLAGIGQTATGQNSQIGMQTAGNVGNALQNAGNARASGIAGSSNAWGNYAGGLAGLAGRYTASQWNGDGSWGWGGI